MRANHRAPRWPRFVDVVCADYELLHAEFDAIIAANFPDAAGCEQRRRPGTAVTTATRRVSSRLSLIHI